MTQQINPTLLDSATLAMLRDTNRLINGDMRIDQRNNGASVAVTSSSPYTVDRWTAGMIGANGTAQRVASGLLGIPNALQITGTASTTTAWIGQKIEAANAAQLVGQRVTVSFYVSSSNQTGLVVNLKYANAADNFGAVTLIESQTVAISSALTRYTVTTAGMMPASAANGLYLEFVSSGNLGTGNIIITGVQLETGLYAGPFEPRPIALELAQCQRYLPAVNYNGGGDRFLSPATSATASVVTVPFPVAPRVAPTSAAVSSPSHFTLYNYANGTSGSPTAIAFSVAGLANGSLSITTTAGSPTLAAGNPVALYASNAAAQILFTGCEL